MRDEDARYAHLQAGHTNQELWEILENKWESVPEPLTRCRLLHLLTGPSSSICAHELIKCVNDPYNIANFKTAAKLFLLLLL